MNGVKTVFKRQFWKFLHEAGRILNSVISPILFVLCFAYIYKNESEATLENVSAFQVIITGLMAVTSFNEGLQAGTEFARDKESGFMKEFLIAPIARSALIAGLTLSNVWNTLLCDAVLLIFSLFVGCQYTVFSIIMIIVCSILAAGLGSTLGIFMACRSRNAGLDKAVLFASLPFIALSGAYVPLNLFPKWLVYVSYFDPLSYLVSFYKYIVLDGLGIGIEEMIASQAIIPFIPPYVCFGIFALMTAGLFVWTSHTFDRKLMK